MPPKLKLQPSTKHATVSVTFHCKLAGGIKKHFPSRDFSSNQKWEEVVKYHGLGKFLDSTRYCIKSYKAQNEAQFGDRIQVLLSQFKNKSRLSVNLVERQQVGGKIVHPLAGGSGAHVTTLKAATSPTSFLGVLGQPGSDSTLPVPGRHRSRSRSPVLRPRMSDDDDDDQNTQYGDVEKDDRSKVIQQNALARMQSFPSKYFMEAKKEWLNLDMVPKTRFKKLLPTLDSIIEQMFNDKVI